MTATDQAASHGHDRRAAYREHLATCPRRHLGILADCVEGALLRAARNGEERPGRPGSATGAAAP
ncbi:hypothetical protein [Streptomyces aureocirculatus]|uniref:hypothetical protein n=1 Tax=Streptomyces aureocirculatus TaxID=67275 RepID=UPI0004CC28F9|nr:hypothetical protein [Streptomyces aureocirculatus]